MHRNPWVQLAGHEGGFKTDVDPHWIFKLANDFEKAALERLREDTLYPFVPQYRGVVVNEGQEFVQMENLLNGFENPNVMDCKIGSRTFLEQDVESTKLRKDLLDKMDSLDPTEATADERAQGITKLRYMQYRETLSSTSSLSFRLEAVRVGTQPDKKLKTVRTKDQVLERFRFFLQDRADIKDAFVARLEAIQQALLVSPFFATHEVVGSSLLFVSDRTGKVDLRVIDFGKTIPRENPLHEEAWDASTLNHADGYLLGLRSLMAIFREA